MVTKNLSWNSIRPDLVKKIEWQTLPKALDISSDTAVSPKHVKISCNSVWHSYKKACSWIRRPITMLKWEMIHNIFWDDQVHYWWIKVLLKNWKVAGSNLTEYLARLWDPTLLQSSGWSSGWNKKTYSDQHWGSEALLKHCDQSWDFQKTWE